MNWRKKTEVIRGSATMVNGRWEIEMSPEFEEQLKGLPSEAQEEVMNFIKGISTGKINPVTMGEKRCGYCAGKMDIASQNEGINMCKTCQLKYV